MLEENITCDVSSSQTFQTDYWANVWKHYDFLMKGAREVLIIINSAFFKLQSSDYYCTWEWSNGADPATPWHSHMLCCGLSPKSFPSDD